MTTLDLVTAMVYGAHMGWRGCGTPAMWAVINSRAGVDCGALYLRVSRTAQSERLSRMSMAGGCSPLSWTLRPTSRGPSCSISGLSPVTIPLRHWSVILGAGHGEGLVWEMEQAVRNVPQQLILLIAMEPREVEAFRLAHGHGFPWYLPPCPPGDGHGLGATLILTLAS
ncbi:hypothetical protein ACGFNU_28325 [Spirillospora sp. NPDC048911]|uniref:hypothetical protein n=1 Tax=Spirillospora sp. NPDC048911 TaxID=3364527 RepID=UPI00371BCE09